MRRQKNMFQIKNKTKTSEKELNKVKIRNLSASLKMVVIKDAHQSQEKNR